MQTAHFFIDGKFQYILNIQYSSIGCSYPRIFVHFPDDSFVNYDSYLETLFGMSKKEWNSWLDDELVEIASEEKWNEMLHEAGLNWTRFKEAIQTIYEKEKGE